MHARGVAPQRLEDESGGEGEHKVHCPIPAAGLYSGVFVCWRSRVLDESKTKWESGEIWESGDLLQAAIKKT